MIWVNRDSSVIFVIILKFYRRRHCTVFYLVDVGVCVLVYKKYRLHRGKTQIKIPFSFKYGHTHTPSSSSF